jgi:hypothetical protein
MASTSLPHPLLPPCCPPCCRCCCSLHPCHAAATSAVFPPLPPRCYRTSQCTAAAAKVALPPSCHLRCQACCRCCRAANATLLLPTPPPRCCDRKCRGLAKLPLLSPSWPPPPCCCRASAAAAATMAAALPLPLLPLPPLFPDIIWLREGRRLRGGKHLQFAHGRVKKKLNFPNHCK